jgi:hypothetical protein
MGLVYINRAPCEIFTKTLKTAARPEKPREHQEKEMKRTIVFIIMDSCRYDTFIAAKTPNMDRIGTVEKRFSYASWTAPSHYAFTMGMMPHKNPRHVFASEVYKEEFALWTNRTGCADIAFRDFLPELSLPKVLHQLGYHTVARVSLPVLNQHTLISKHFDDYKLMDHHNQFAEMVEEITFSQEEPRYYFLNIGETHYPYMLSGKDLPVISGVHGVFKALGGTPRENAAKQGAFFDSKQMQQLFAQQIRCVEYIDDQIGRLMTKSPENTCFIITSDHGELFGEDGFFGHGPIMHEKCFEVPYVEGFLK